MMDGINDGKRGQSRIREATDKNAVHNIIKRLNELREHHGRRHFEKDFIDPLCAEIMALFFDLFHNQVISSSSAFASTLSYSQIRAVICRILRIPMDAAACSSTFPREASKGAAYSSPFGVNT